MKWRLLSWVIMCTRKRGRIFLGEKLDTAMQLNNVKNKYTVVIFQGEKKKDIVQLPLGKSGTFEKTIFSFLKAAKENRCQIIIYDKAVNQNDGLIFAAEEKFIYILEERLPKLL